MADENYTEYYYNEETGEEGIEIAGKDVILLNAHEVLLSPDTPLLTEAQDLAGAINELFQSGGGGGDGNLRSIIDNNSSTIIIGIEDEVDSEKIVTDNHYSYIKKDFTESITIHKTCNNNDGSTTKTTITKNFSKSVITNLYNPSGLEILRVECDSKGNVLGYYDTDGNEIYVS